MNPLPMHDEPLSPSLIDGKLQEQLNAVQKEITRLEYQNNELDQKYAALLSEGVR